MNGSWWAPAERGSLGYMGSDRRVTERANCYPSTDLQRSTGFVFIPMLVTARQTERRV